VKDDGNIRSGQIEQSEIIILIIKKKNPSKLLNIGTSSALQKDLQANIFYNCHFYCEVGHSSLQDHTEHPVNNATAAL